MRVLPVVLTTAAAITLAGSSAGCSSPTSAANLRVGDCVKLGGTVDRPEATKVTCGSPTSNFKVVATVEGGAERDRCPTDVDSSYSMRKMFSDSVNTACLDIDWVVGDCMSVDPQAGTDPFRASCDDPSVPHLQRATQILKDVVRVDQCASGLGYAYDERRFTVCVEDIA